ncbi:MAG: transposase [Verrucomicrobiales bacterium]
MIQDPPPGFLGLRSDIPICTYRRNLPHWRQTGATYFVTFRLGDSIPPEKAEVLRFLRNELSVDRDGEPDLNQQDQIRRIVSAQERWLDQGYGKCLFQNRAMREIATDALRFFDKHRYDLVSYVVMPNHIHAILKPFDLEGHTLEKVLQSWKRHTSREINKLRNEEGPIWHGESYDRIIRDLEHLRRCIDYIGRNPAKAGRSDARCPRWIRSDWEAVGWGFR